MRYCWLILLLTISPVSFQTQPDAAAGVATNAVASEPQARNISADVDLHPDALVLLVQLRQQGEE